MLAYLFALFIANLLDIAGIGGFIAGLFIRRWAVVASVGVVVGVIKAIILAYTRYTDLDPSSWIMPIFVAVLTATLGWWLRGRKLTQKKRVSGAEDRTNE